MVLTYKDGITTEAAVGTIKEKEPAMPAGGGMGMY